MSPRHSVLRGWLGYLPIWSVFTLLAALPERAAYVLTDVLGRLYLLCDRKRMRISLAGLSRACPGMTQQARRRMAYHAAGSFAMILADIARMPRMQRRGLVRSRVDMAQLEAAIARARELSDAPPILCTPHLGSWEASIAAAAMLLDPIHLIGRRMKNPLLDRRLYESRSRIGQKVYPKKGGMRPLARAIENRQAVAFAADQNQRRGKVFVRFFGELASCDRGPVRLSEQFGSPLLVGAAVRIGRCFRFRVEIQEVLIPQGNDEATLQRLHAAFERLILRFPEQYLWMHDRWRTRPRGEEPGREGVAATLHRAIGAPADIEAQTGAQKEKARS